MPKYNVDDEMTRVVTSLSVMDPSKDDYGAAVKNLETLSKVKAVKSQNRIGWIHVFEAAVHLGGLFAVLYYEKLDVISSKVFNEVWRRR